MFWSRVNLHEDVLRVFFVGIEPEPNFRADIQANDGLVVNSTNFILIKFWHHIIEEIKLFSARFFNVIEAGAWKRGTVGL